MRIGKVNRNAVFTRVGKTRRRLVFMQWSNKWLMRLAAMSLVLVFALAGCAGGGGSDGNSDDGGANTPASVESDGSDGGSESDGSVGGAESGGSDGGGEAQAIAEGAGLVIPLSEIGTTAKFYKITVEGALMEVVAVEAPDGTIRTAFNTCQICYGSGRGYYKQSGNALICQNCGNSFAMDRVEVEAGGCNPWPIFPENKTVTDESITISWDFLKASKEIFANWKVEY